MDQGLPVGAVIEDKDLVVHPVAEVGPQQGQHPVFGLDLPGQHPLKFREAGKALEQVDLSVQVAHCLEQGEHRVVAEAAQQGPAPAVQGADEAVEDPLPLRRAGEEPLDHQFPGVGVDFPQAHQNPFRAAWVSFHLPGREQGRLQAVPVLEARRVLLIYIAVKDTAEEALKGSIIAVDRFHRHFSGADLCAEYFS